MINIWRYCRRNDVAWGVDLGMVRLGRGFGADDVTQGWGFWVCVGACGTIRSRLARVHAVNHFVTGQQNSDDCAPTKPTTAPMPAAPPLPIGWIHKYCEEHGWLVAAPIPVPAPAPTAPPMRVLRNPCLFFISFTQRTSCFWMVCSLRCPGRECCAGDTTRVPECFFEFISTIWIFCTACRPLKLA